MIMEMENLKSYMTDINCSVASVMASSSHTLPCCVSKLRSSLEAGKKQLRIWLQYVYDVAEMLLYPSFRDPFVLLLSPYGDSEMALWVLGRAKRQSRARRWFEVVRYGQRMFMCQRSGLRWSANLCSKADEAMFDFMDFKPISPLHLFILKVYQSLTKPHITFIT